MVNVVRAFHMSALQQFFFGGEHRIKGYRSCRVPHESNNIHISWRTSCGGLYVLQKAAIQPVKSLNAQSKQFRLKMKEAVENDLAFWRSCKSAAKLCDRAWIR